MMEMKLKCIMENGVDLTLGKIYECLCIDEKRSWYGITDDSGDSYWYDKDLFEVVEDSGKKD